MSSLKKKLECWKQEGFISPEQVEKISTYENLDAVSSKVLYTFITLGVSVIGIGIIAIIAANWDVIPPAVKLVNNFLFLSILAVSCYYCYFKNAIIRTESLLFLMMLSIMASIGLITQIYHSSGNLSDALLLWSLLTFPLMTLSQRQWISFIWSFIFTTSLYFFWVDHLGCDSFCIRDSFTFMLPIISIFLLCIILNRLSLKFAPTYLLAKSWSRIALGWGIYTLIYADISVTNASEFFVKPAMIGSMLINLLLMLTLVIGIQMNKAMSTSQRTFYLLILLLFAGYEYLVYSQWSLSPVIPALLTILCLVLFAIHFANCGQTRRFQLMIIFVGLRFLVIYFQVIGTLAMTGIGLIISGILIIILTLLIGKNMNTLKHFAEVILK